jgi:predicted RNA-binding Zn ribbon-like protein
VDPESLVGLGDHPALDFLNSTATPSRVTIELIGDGAGYLRWLELAGLVRTGEGQALRSRFSPAELNTAAAAATELREWLRPVIAAWAAGDPGTPGEDTQAYLNKIMAADSRHAEITRAGQKLSVTDRRVWNTPQALLAPPAQAAADLFAHGDRSLVRNCEGPACTLWFYDRTKAHQRRWCSMAICGNRAKARAHRQRLTGPPSLSAP